MTTQAPPSSSTPTDAEPELPQCLECLSDQLTLTDLWATLSNCQKELADTPDHSAVLVLQPTLEAFFLVHTAVISSELKKKPKLRKLERSNKLLLLWLGLKRTKKFLAFGYIHQTVLILILRQSSTHLAVKPFSLLVNLTRVLKSLTSRGGTSDLVGETGRGHQVSFLWIFNKQF